MKYLLLMYADESIISNYAKEEFLEASKEWAGLVEEMTEAGVLISNSGLAPTANATTVRVREGKTLITDGPFAETHEQLGGYILVECEDLDEAIFWAKKVPTAQYGSLEIRPLWFQGLTNY